MFQTIELLQEKLYSFIYVYPWPGDYYYYYCIYLLLLQYVLGCKVLERKN